MFWLLSATAVFLFLLYKFTRKPNDYFEKRSVKYPKPKSALLAIPTLIFKKRSLPEVVQDYYTKFPEEK